MASGVFPDTVYTNSTNLVQPWVAAGGTLVWIGDHIGTYSGVPGVQLKYPSPSNPGDNGTKEFLNLSILGAPTMTYTDPTPVSSNFSVDYTFGLHGTDFNLTALEANGGIALGPTSSGYSNVASIPDGTGHLVIFGGPLDDATSVSLVIDNILQSNIFGGSLLVLGHLPITTPASGTDRFGFFVRVPSLPFSRGLSELCSYFLETDYAATFANLACIDVP